MKKFNISYGLILIVLGIGAGALSRVWDSGFVHGLFQGAALALVLFGVYFAVQAWRRPDTKDGMWRPSQGEPHRDR